MHVVGTFYDDKMADMAAITDPIKKEFCDRYSIPFVAKTDNFPGNHMGFARLHTVRELLHSYQNGDWLLLIDCDAMFTNLNTTIDDKIDNDYNIIYTMCFNGVNVGVALFRNTKQTREHVDTLLGYEPMYINHPWSEQQLIIDSLAHFQTNQPDLIKIVPMRHMNSLQKEIYNTSQLPTPYDLLHQSMLWEPGDWIVHWPGAPNSVRIPQAYKMLARVQR